ncbi:DEAD/DEAH box helicase [Vibrio sp. ZSDZ34]|uniref:DEAD/DEAH box helicase n=1 Tax=Vibrio gelatinilyticus TaxID=2893468 RepID=A0A9X1WBW7_9VIBR|nr:helicase-related protein [Vibrio gelatinilyticus]MCJ2377419.1 DEAD/DEAH box helicase [Vibrio gelatinilyticus]
MTSLPIDSIESEFHQIISSSHLVVEAETGSGKSTRLPLWAKQHGRVLVVEPRRIACTSLATYLAQCEGQKVGERIGYAIKLHNVYSDDSRVVFVTPGIALRWYAENKLANFDIVMVDEFHERRWDTDLLVALLNTEQTHRIIVTSATIEGEKLSHYIDGHRMEAHGRNYGVDIEYRRTDSRQLPDARQLENKVAKEVELLLIETTGDVLVFLPGRKEISLVRSALKKMPVASDVIIAPLHASVCDEERQCALEVQSRRKIVLATNVAETSLTIPNIEVVVDSGLERRNIQRNGRTTLMLTHISKASAKQRSGRAGRVMHGVCVRLYGEHAALENVTPPELQRESLVEPMLAAATCGHSLESLDFIDELPKKTLLQASEQLEKLGALDANGITEHGRRLYPLPVDTLYADLITRMPNKALMEAMVDLTAALSTIGRIAQPSSDPESVERLNQQEPNLCDGELLIRLLRGQVFDGVTVDEQALNEAQLLAAQMRDIFKLPNLEVASRFKRQEWLTAILTSHPELVFVRRKKRRDALGNGSFEVLPARNTRFSDKEEAAVVLDTHSLPGRGVKQTLNLATVMLPIPLSLMIQHEFGEWIQGDTITGEEGVLSELRLEFAGRTLTTKQIQAKGEFALRPIIEAVQSGVVMPGFAKQRQQQISHWKMYVEMGLSETHVTIEHTNFESWFTHQLSQLEISDFQELDLFESDDFVFEGIPDWEYPEFAEKYPLEINLSGLRLDVEYYPAGKRVLVVYQSGSRKGDPKRKELPAWQGWKVQYRKASRLLDLR